MHTHYHFAHNLPPLRGNSHVSLLQLVRVCVVPLAYVSIRRNVDNADNDAASEFVQNAVLLLLLKSKGVQMCCAVFGRSARACACIEGACVRSVCACVRT